MINSDTFVGSVAILMGLAIMVSATLNTGAFNRFWLSRSLQKKYGSAVARIAAVTAGILLAILGLMLVNGMLPLKNAGLNRASTADSTIQRAVMPVWHS